MDQLSTLGKASLGSFWRNLICTVAWSPLGEEDISTKDLVLCQSTCCAMRVFPYFSNVISNLRLNMHREGWALSLPNTSRPCGHVQGLFKTAWLKSDQSSSKQTQEPSNLRCFYMNIQMGGFGLPQPAATLNSTLQTAHRYFHKGREHLWVPRGSSAWSCSPLSTQFEMSAS